MPVLLYLSLQSYFLTDHDMPLLGFVSMSYLLHWRGSFWEISPAAIFGVLHSLAWWHQSQVTPQCALETGSLPVWMQGPPVITPLAVHDVSLRQEAFLLLKV